MRFFIAHMTLFLGMTVVAGCSTADQTSSSLFVTDTDDRDGDGLSAEEGDCNDEDATIDPGFADLLIDEIDQNCDGVDGPDVDEDGHVAVEAGGLDCDDSDPSSTTTIEDPDCDGFSAAEDCDDTDPTSTTIYEDSDCDGFVDQPCSSLLFDGVDDSMTTNTQFSFQDFGVEMWIKLPILGNTNRILVDSRDDSEEWRFTLLITEDCQFRAEIRPIGSYTRHLTDAASLCNNSWNHVAFIREGQQIRIFVGGKEVSNHSFPGGPFPFPAPLIFGKRTIPDARYQQYQGLIHSVHISDQARYTTDFIPSQQERDEHTQALWFFGEGSGEIVRAEGGDWEGQLDGVGWIEDCPYVYR